MALVLVLVAALVVLLPRPQEQVRQPVDVADAAAAARSAQAPHVVPDLPDGWTATSARFTPQGVDGVPTWHVGYLTPSQRYAGLEVAAGVTPGWLEEQTSEGVDAGARDVAGVSWVERVSPDGARRSLVTERDGVTTVVTGTATLDELVVLAAAASR